MANNRGDTRHLKRVNLRFGVDAPTRIAFTEDISTQGFFIKSGFVLDPGTLLQVEITLPDNSVVSLEGRVRWARRVPPALLRRIKGGMGVRIRRFISGEDAYRAFCSALGDRRSWSAPSEEVSSPGANG